MDTASLSPQLIEQAAAGDQEAFALLAHRMLPLIRLCVARVPHDDVNEDDLLQEALMALLDAVNHYRPDGGAAFTTYATACIRNRLVSFLRRNAPATMREQPFDDEYDTGDPTADPAELLQQQEDALHLQHQLRERLTDLEYRVLLHRLQGLSYKDIAGRLSVGEKAVDNAVQRLRRKMAGLL